MRLIGNRNGAIQVRKKLNRYDIEIFRKEKLIKDLNYVESISPSLNISIIISCAIGFFIIYANKNRYTTKSYDNLINNLFDLEIDK
jgi:hypothetical protein